MQLVGTIVVATRSRHFHIMLQPQLLDIIVGLSFPLLLLFAWVCASKVYVLVVCYVADAGGRRSMYVFCTKNTRASTYITPSQHTHGQIPQFRVILGARP